MHICLVPFENFDSSSIFFSFKSGLPSCQAKTLDIEAGTMSEKTAKPRRGSRLSINQIEISFPSIAKRKGLKFYYNLVRAVVQDRSAGMSSKMKEKSEARARSFASLTP